MKFNSEWMRLTSLNLEKFKLTFIITLFFFCKSFCLLALNMQFNVLLYLIADRSCPPNTFINDLTLFKIQ